MSFGYQEHNICSQMGIVNATSNDYNDLAHKPSINGVVLEGNKTTDELNISGDKTYVHTQRVASEVWEIQHNLNKYPTIAIVDSGNSVVVGEIKYIDENNVTVTFTSPFSGKAFCN